MSKVIVDNLQTTSRIPYIPLSELWYRPLKSVIQTYTSGQWNPDTNYNWVPGMYIDYVPVSSRSRIKASCTIPYVGLNHAAGISHWIFYANGIEIAKHCVAGNHIEDCTTYAYDVGSWGTTSARIGYQMRAYANDNHEVRPYTTRYWDGGASNQVCYGQMIIEEYIENWYGGAEKYFYVGNNSAISYVFTGEITGEDLTINATVGDKLNFIINASGHPFWIKTAATTGTTNPVTTGTITGTNGTDIGNLTWNTTGVNPGTYYYICQFHGTMSGQIIIAARPS
jgi:plastocyanin